MNRNVLKSYNILIGLTNANCKYIQNYARLHDYLSVDNSLNLFCLFKFYYTVFGRSFST